MRHSSSCARGASELVVAGLALAHDCYISDPDSGFGSGSGSGSGFGFDYACCSGSGSVCGRDHGLGSGYDRSHACEPATAATSMAYYAKTQAVGYAALAGAGAGAVDADAAGADTCGQTAVAETDESPAPTTVVSATAVSGNRPPWNTDAKLAPHNFPILDGAALVKKAGHSRSSRGRLSVSSLSEEGADDDGEVHVVLSWSPDDGRTVMVVRGDEMRILASKGWMEIEVRKRVLVVKPKKVLPDLMAKPAKRRTRGRYGQ